MNEAPEVKLQESWIRIKNMAVAAAMIVVMVGRHLAVGVVGKRLENGAMRTVHVGTAWGSRMMMRLMPRINHWQQRALDTRQRVRRRVLVALIAVVGPVEAYLNRVLMKARQGSNRVVRKSVTTSAKILAPMVTALADGIKAGLNRPGMQKTVARLHKIADDSKK